MSTYENFSPHFLSEVCDAPYYSDADFREGITPADVVESDMRAASYARIQSPNVGKTGLRASSEFMMCLVLMRQIEQGGNE